MSKLKRPSNVPETAPLYRVWVDIHENGVYFKFHRGAGIGIRRDNPEYYKVIGQWFCNEVDALSTLPDCPHGVEGGRLCVDCGYPAIEFGPDESEDEEIS